MRSVFKKSLACLVALTMFVCVFVVSGYAAEQSEDAIIYTCLGDSIAAGFGTTGYQSHRIPAPNAYHSLVAESLGAQLINFGSAGFRTNEMRYILDPDYNERDTAYEIGLESLGIREFQLDEIREDMINAIKSSDLITIELGANDCFTGYTSTLGEIRRSNYFTEQKEQFANNEQILSILSSVESAIKTYRYITTYIQYIIKVLPMFKENWDAVVKNIRIYNPDATIIAIGLCNVLGNMSTKEDSKFKFGSLLDAAFDAFSNYIERKSPYHNEYIFCDISDLELGDIPTSTFTGRFAFQDPDFVVTILRKIHPNDEQHALIATRIVELVQRNGLGMIDASTPWWKTYFK